MCAESSGDRMINAQAHRLRVEVAERLRGSTTLLDSLAASWDAHLFDGDGGVEMLALRANLIIAVLLMRVRIVQLALGHCRGTRR